MRDAAMHVRMLGAFSVTRADGSVVPDAAWRTGKTTDLVRLLALADARPVRVASLTHILWPGVDDERARGSLRTAASQVRRAVGTDCVERRHDGLALVGASADVLDFLAAADLVRRAVEAGDHEQVLAQAWAAEELHTGEFRAFDDESAWAQLERARVARSRVTMLCDAASSALERRRHRDARLLAERAVEGDAGSEEAHRLLMRAYAGLGEVGSALRVFERFRRHLVQELGVDPSRQTQELYLSLLRGS